MCPHCKNSAENMRLARCHIPTQKIGQLLPPDTALRKGTVFPELSMPYDPVWRASEAESKAESKEDGRDES